MTEDQRIAAAFAALIAATTGEAREAAEAELEAADPDLVSRVGLTRYGTVGYHTGARQLLGHVMLKVRDPAALAERVLAAWSRGPRSKYYYGDFPIVPGAAPAIVGQPAVLARMIADASALDRGEAEKEMARRRGVRAIRLLGYSKHPEAIAFLDAIVQRERAIGPPFGERTQAYFPAVDALADARG